MSGDGRFVVAWTSIGQDLGGAFAQRFDAAGAPLGGEILLNVYTAGVQSFPAVTPIDGGGFAAAWQSNLEDGSGYGVFSRRFDSAGSGVGTETRVNAFIDGDQTQPSTGSAPGGGFVVAWQSSGQDGYGSGIFARPVGGDAASGPDLQVNTFFTGNQVNAALAAGATGEVVVTWQSIGQDGDVNGIFARRYQALDVFDIDGNGVLDALTDGLLALRFLFGFSGSTLIGGAVGPGCTRCTAPAIESYLQTLI
jgi:hypothetical protein